MAAAMASSMPAVNAAKEGGVGAADSDESVDVVIVGVVRSSPVPPWTEPVVSVGGGGVEYVMRTVHMGSPWSKPSGCGAVSMVRAPARTGVRPKVGRPWDQGPEPDRTVAPAAVLGGGAGWVRGEEHHGRDDTP